MRLITPSGLTRNLEWMYSPSQYQDQVILQFRDERPLSRIAPDFEGCESLRRESSNEGNLDYLGYTELIALLRPDPSHPDLVQLTLAKPDWRQKPY